MTALSSNFLTFKKTGRGYRNDAISAITDPSLKEVLDFEIGELENTDILDFAKENYRLSKKKEIILLCQKKLHVDADTPLYAFWLTSSKQDVIDSYLDQGDTVISQYHIDKPFVLLSDLGSDGFLLASTEPLSAFFEKEVEVEPVQREDPEI